jgi:GNAT superfamily N-acetyltransferase
LTTTNKDVEVRAIQQGEEDGAYALMADIFMSNTDKPAAAQSWRAFVESAPGQPPDRARAAFLEDRCVGVYVIDEREVRLAGARVPAGFIGMVGVQRQLRGGGIGTAMMNDSFAYARRRGLVLLVLHGAPRYYTPFGYVDAFDTSDVSFRRLDVRALGLPPLTVRAAVVEDAGAIAELYEVAHGPYSGWCERSEAQEQHWLRFAILPAKERGELFDTTGPVVAVDNQGEVQGYLRQGWGPLRSFGCEVAAASPEAVLSLAAYHSWLRGPLQGRDEVVTWQLPPGSLTAAWLGDFVPVAVASTHRPEEGWMAAVTEKAMLIDGLVESWSGGDGAQGSFSLRVGDIERTVGRVPAGNAAVGVDEATLVQLLFGYREPSWARAQPGCVVPALPAVEHRLTNQPWIPPTNGW